MAKNKQRAEALAQKIIENAKSSLILKLRFLDTALCALIPQAQEGKSMGTEGYFLHFNPKHVILTYQHEPNAITRDYLHTVLHCVFHHAFVGPAINPARWNLACDIAVENAISELGLNALACSRTAEQQNLLSMLNGNVKLLSAEKIYRLLTEYQLSDRQFEELRGPFFADDHDLWYLPPDDVQGDTGADKGQPDDGKEPGDSDNPHEKGNPDENDESHDNSEPRPQNEHSEQGDNNNLNSRSHKQAPSRENLSKMWSEISKRAQVDLETTSREWGDKTDSLTQTLGIINREKYDYTEFLRRFCSIGEATEISDDEFDYIFYTYGLKLYKNLPLIEPLEYKEVKKIREFAVVIDTSGSVEGEKVQKFVQKTYNILKQSNSFFTRVNVHIIQADTEVKEDVKITSDDELSNYIAQMKLIGFGGTDFRPAFQHIDALIAKKEFTDFKGLIYFTDGEGIYPNKMPNYPAAFVFVDKDIPPAVPSWAIKLILDDEELER